MGSPAPGTAATFRDPDGVLQQHDDRVLRLIRPHAVARFKELLAEDVVVRLMRAGTLVNTWPAPHEAIPAGWRSAEGSVYEHERIAFVSYPCEWSAAMLARAAELTLETALELLAKGFMLKDATPANVLFRGSRPVLVDVPSIVPRPSGTFLWLARQQFERSFLLPLIANLTSGIPIAWSLQDPGTGLSHERLARILGWRRWLQPHLVRSVALPAALAGATPRAGHLAQEPRMANDERARFVLERSLGSLVATVRRYRKRLARQHSHWAAYQTTRTHYSDTDLAVKRAFVSDAFSRQKPQWTLDVGCNTGEFSELAARHSRVIAIDSDEAAVGNLWQRAHEASLDIQPLVVDFARPTPGSGWQNGESRAFIDRCRSRFDCVLMLAVVHHLRVASGVPLAQIVELVARLCRGHVVLEFVPVTDPMFARIARGREPLYADYTRENIERLLGERFEIQSTRALSNGRILYLAARRGPGTE
jgi:SAM-dependent methyltransferase